METACSYCGLAFEDSLDRCPHCARPALFPNVVAAGRPEEKLALASRYRLALVDADTRGCRKAIAAFERAIDTAKVVINRSIPDMLKIATSDREVYGTFYKTVGAGLRLPSGNKWDTLRALVDSALFPHYKDEVRFGSLSLDNQGLASFGPCSIMLRTDLMDYRVSLFEGNSILFMIRAGLTIESATDLPLGYRSVWADRALHAVAKLGGRVSSSTNPAEYARLVLANGSTPDSDDFIEAHVYGSMTIQTMERVTVSGKLKRSERAMLRGLREMLDQVSIPLELH